MRNLAILLVVASLAACGHDGGNLAEGEKPAAHAPAADPHAGVDPHARVNPHAGLDPHAGVDPHAGMTPPAPAPAADAPIAWTVPGGWQGGASSRAMRVAEFDVGQDEAGVAVQCVVYGGIGGDDEQNLSRWVEQMGETAKASAKTTHSEHDGLKITRLEVRGSYTDTMRAGGAKTVGDAKMLAAIVDGPMGKLHVKLAGASSVVDAAAAQFDAFLASMKAK